MMMNRISIILFFMICILIINSCGNSNAPTDTPTTGNLKISVDETYKPLIESEIKTFESIYSYAKISVSYKSELEAFNDLMNDTIKLIIVPRSLNKDELAQFEKWEIVPKVTKIAVDAIAVICSKDVSDSTITFRQLRLLIDSNNQNMKSKKLKVVFDHDNSSTISFLREKIGVNSFSKNCYALDSSKAVLNYIALNKQTVGIIGVNWISDLDDSTNVNFLKSVKVLEVSENDSSESYKPYQGYIAKKLYPMYREVYIISKEAYTGLGTGFTAFIASERGQRIVLKFGLVPATMPVRIVEIINEEL